MSLDVERWIVFSGIPIDLLALAFDSRVLRVNLRYLQIVDSLSLNLKYIQL